MTNTMSAVYDQSQYRSTNRWQRCTWPIMSTQLSSYTRMTLVQYDEMTLVVRRQLHRPDRPTLLVLVDPTVNREHLRDNSRVAFAGGTGHMSWSLNFEVWHLMAYFVLMCYGHSISPPSLTSSRNPTLDSSAFDTCSAMLCTRSDIQSKGRNYLKTKIWSFSVFEANCFFY